MPKIFPVAIFIGLLVVLTQFARTAPDGYRQTEAADLSSSQESQFRLKQSYPITSDHHDLLATIYSCGSGVRQKEILSIWSRKSNSYELQYIRTAAAGQTFAKPEIFTNKKMSFIKIATLQPNTRTSAINTVLSVSPESTLQELQELTQRRKDTKKNQF